MKISLKSFLYMLIVLILFIVFFFFRRIEKEYNSITTYQECLDAGYPMIATYPEQCKIPGKTFINQTQKPSTLTATSTLNLKNYKNISYLINDKRVELVNSIAINDLVSGSVSKETVRYFGNEVRGDFDNNGTEDIAFLITKESGGSGTFFYIVVALLSIDHVHTGTNAILLGDRIAPGTTSLKNDQIVVNYADRKDGEPMTTKPSVGVSRYFKIINHSLVEVTE